ncbi:MAG: hypothetical protein QFX33_04285 [Candidatus Nezhaarchaeota archaeon]|nr:hypothetical protein [Candidatus Nezhaarchaeota archaeon]
MDGVIYVFLSHDVDWSRRGPGLEHVLARRDRFDNCVVRRVLEEEFNPYFNVPEVMDVEERFGVASTFFFRPTYDDGLDVSCYEDVIRDLASGGWEVGLHINDASSAESIAEEKMAVEGVLGSRVVGCRAHYLRVREESYRMFREAGLKYDSSIKSFKDRIDVADMGFRLIHGIPTFPVTIMDAYLFTYMHVPEEEVVRVVEEAIDLALRRGERIVTILWHDCSLRMRGGRMYGKLVEALASREEVKVVRGVDLLEVVKH